MKALMTQVGAHPRRRKYDKHDARATLVRASYRSSYPRRRRVHQSMKDDFDLFITVYQAAGRDDEVGVVDDF